MNRSWLIREAVAGISINQLFERLASEPPKS